MKCIPTGWYAPLLLPLAMGCPSKDTDTFQPTPLDCAQESTDSCIQASCQACVDTCGIECLVEDLYPPNYVCADLGATWTARDMCPTWEPREGGK